MKIAGWKNISMIDVKGAVTFTLWLCGCNLRCPFCHNWRIAEGLECKTLDEKALLEEISLSKPFIDYLHITGGEPLLQWMNLMNLITKIKSLEVSISLNSNLTLVQPLKKFLYRELIDHIATDLKAPPKKLYGIPSWKKLWRLYLKSLRIISDYGIPMELRVPVTKGIEGYKEYIEEAIETLKYEDFYIVINPLIGSPITHPRDERWCLKHCNPGEREINKVKNIIEELGVEKLSINPTLQSFYIL